MLLGTVVFMFSFMDRDYLVPTFALLIGIWAGCWWIGRTPWTVSTRRRMLAWLEGAAVAAVVGRLPLPTLCRESRCSNGSRFRKRNWPSLHPKGRP